MATVVAVSLGLATPQAHAIGCVSGGAAGALPDIWLVTASLVRWVAVSQAVHEQNINSG